MSADSEREANHTPQKCGVRKLPGEALSLSKIADRREERGSDANAGSDVRQLESTYRSASRRRLTRRCPKQSRMRENRGVKTMRERTGNQHGQRADHLHLAYVDGSSSISETEAKTRGSADEYGGSCSPVTPISTRPYSSAEITKSAEVFRDCGFAARLGNIVRQLLPCLTAGGFHSNLIRFDPIRLRYRSGGLPPPLPRYRSRPGSSEPQKLA